MTKIVLICGSGRVQLPHNGCAAADDGAQLG